MNCCLYLTLAPVPDKAKIRLKQEFGNGTKNSLQVLNELGLQRGEAFSVDVFLSKYHSDNSCKFLFLLTLRIWVAYLFFKCK